MVDSVGITGDYKMIDFLMNMTGEHILTMMAMLWLVVLVVKLIHESKEEK